MLVASDLPRHRVLRKLVRITTSAPYVDRARTETRNLLAAALDKVEREGGGSVSEDLSLCLPMGALMAIFGISSSRARELIAMTRSMIGIEDPFYGGSLNGNELRLSSIHADMLGFFDDELEYRRDNPSDDFITYLLNAKVDGYTLTDEEILFNCMNLAVGGNETSSYTASTGVFLFSEHKSAYNTLLERPELMDDAVNEILRWASTNCYVLRKCTRDFELNGTTIKRGDLVTLWNVSANRDQEVFRDPDAFDILRTPNRHLAYGHGVHRCVGAPLAAMELDLFFRQLVDRKLRLEVDGDVRWLRSNFINGPAILNVSVCR
nr:cytochrome P450 [Nocardia altamirensis]